MESQQDAFVIVAVLIVLNTFAGSRDIFLGCYMNTRYHGSFWVNPYVNSTSMDVNYCGSICSQDAFDMSLIGLNDGQNCFCLTFLEQGMKVALIKSDNSKCDTLCSGAPKCGGRDVIAVYDARSQSFLGCFDYSSSEMSLDWDDGMAGERVTINTCNRFCSNGPYNCTALMNGNECYCINYLPSTTSTTNEMCLTYGQKCAGAQRCGGSDTLSIWKTIDDSSAYNYDSLIRTGSVIRKSARHIGCQESNSDNAKLWWRGPYRNQLNLSVNWCLGICWQNRFRLIGLLQGSECYCFTAHQVLRDLNTVESAKCDKVCEGDKKCGGRKYLVLYNTSSSALIGCFKDRDQTGLGLLPRHPPSLLTLENCLATCRESFKYAGMEGGRQCYCGDIAPDTSSRTTDSLCLIYGADCTGADKCGGSDSLDMWEMLEVKHIGVGNVTNISILTSSSATTQTDTPEDAITSLSQNNARNIVNLLTIVAISVRASYAIYAVLQRWRKCVRNRYESSTSHLYAVVEKETDTAEYMEVVE